MEWSEVEGLADAAFKVAGLDASAPAKTLQLVAGVIGTASVQVLSVPDLLAPAALARVRGDWRVYLRPELSPAAKRWLVLHEVAEWLLRRESYAAVDVEEVADSLAACLRAPRRAVLAISRKSWSDLGPAFKTSASSALLRAGEVLGTPTLLLAKTQRVRGSAWNWPSQQQLRAMVAHPPRGIECLRLESDRIALRVA